MSNTSPSRGRIRNLWNELPLPTESKRLIRGALREYRKHGVRALFELTTWYTLRMAAPNLRSAYYIRWITRDVERLTVPFDPYALIWVDPDEITHETNRDRPKWASFASNIGSVRGGDWDRNLSEGLSQRHESFVAHFEDGVAWEDTQLFEEAVETIAGGEYTLRMSTTEEELLQRCHEIDALYAKIRAEGYRTQAELGTYDTKLERLGNEIQVDVGRDGRLLLVEGRHRLSLAKLLNIDAVPVVVVCRHRVWVDHLEACYRRGGRVDHPDWNSVRP